MRLRASALLLAAMTAGCGNAGPSASAHPTGAAATVAPQASVPAPSASAPGNAFPTALFAGLSEKPASEGLAAALQDVLDTSADGSGMTATLITAQGTWTGASGMATVERAMVPDDQIAIYSITKTIVAAQVMQLAEAGSLRLDDLAANHLPPDVAFDTNGARIVDLLSMRSGIPEYLIDDEALARDWLHVWTAEEKLATVARERGPVGQDWDYNGTNYILLGLIIEQVTGRSVAQALRGGVLAGRGYERLIYQPDERPTAPWSVTEELGLSADTFTEAGGYLPSLSVVTMYANDGNMASDSASVARWFRALCAGQVVSPASVATMTDFSARPGYGLGVIDRSGEYWPGSGAVGHKGGNHTIALCFQDPASVIVVLANREHDVDTLAGQLVRAAGT